MEEIFKTVKQLADDKEACGYFCDSSIAVYLRSLIKVIHLNQNSLMFQLTMNTTHQSIIRSYCTVAWNTNGCLYLKHHRTSNIC